ncbi:hypothetical protein [Sphingobium sp. ZW T5_29]|uniref:hypothetical protein n=1 Tax=Sphingobium sp. ZW T5_29 TaxID=3378077 RepID=UPI003853E45F
MASSLISDWESWADDLSGDGAMSVSSGVLTASSAAGAGSAYKTRRLTVEPGDIVTLRCMARLVSTAGISVPGGPRVGFNINTTGSSFISHSEVITEDWAMYECSAQIPLHAPSPSYARPAIGVYTDQGGEAEFTKPSIEISKGQYGTPRVMAWGLLKFDAGVPTVQTDYVRGGNIAGTYNSGTKKGVLTVPKSEGFAQPLFFEHQYAESGKNLRFMLDDYEPTGTINYGFYDKDGALVDVSAINSIYVGLMMVC